MKNILVVGIGSIGKRHISNFNDYFDKIDVVDVNEQRINQVKKDYKINNSYNDYRVAISENAYDAISINTPPHIHLDIAKLAAINKINLFIEKPLGISSFGWDEIINICKENKLINYVAFCHRHINYSKRFKELIESNKYGKPLHACIRWGSYLPDWHPWEDYRSFYMSKKEQGGGALLDESHGLDLVRFFLGEVKNVFALVKNISDLEITSDDTSFLTLETYDNSLVQINFDLTSRSPRISFELVLTEGILIWDRIEHKIKIFDSKTKEWNEEIFKFEDMMQMYEDQAKYFYNCITQNLKPVTDIADALKTQRIIDAAFESNETKKIVSIK